MENFTSTELQAIEDFAVETFDATLEKETNKDQEGALKRTARSLSLKFHPDKCKIGDLNIPKIPIKKRTQLKDQICNEVFKTFQNLIEQVESYTPKEGAEDWETAEDWGTGYDWGRSYEDEIRDYMKSQQKTGPYTGSKPGEDIFIDPIFGQAWECRACGTVMNAFGEFGQDVICPGCDFPRYGPGPEEKEPEGVKITGSKAKVDRSTKKAFKEFMRDNYDVKVTDKNFGEFYEDYSDEFEAYQDYLYDQFQEQMEMDEELLMFEQQEEMPQLQ